MVPSRATHHIYKIVNTLKLFWLTVDSSVLLNEGVQFFFHDICHFFVCIADCNSSRNLVLVPAGCTSKCKPLNVCINKPFKGVLRNFWEDYFANIVTKLSSNVRVLSFYCHRNKILLTGLLKALVTWKFIPIWLKIHFAFVDHNKWHGQSKKWWIP